MTNLRTIVVIVGILGVCIWTTESSIIISGKTINDHKDQAEVFLPKEANLPKIVRHFNKAMLTYPRGLCINLGDEGCTNGVVIGSGSDGGFLTGGNNPGR